METLRYLGKRHEPGEGERGRLAVSAVLCCVCVLSACLVLVQRCAGTGTAEVRAGKSGAAQAKARVRFERLGAITNGISLFSAAGVLAAQGPHYPANQISAWACLAYLDVTIYFQCPPVVVTLPSRWLGCLCRAERS